MRRLLVQVLRHDWRSSLWILLALVPGLWALLIRTPVPVDETRYLTVAWEMWLRHDLLVPHLNGAPYSHKPPMFFWIVQAGWALFGVTEWWPRLIEPMASVAAIGLTICLAHEFWPLDRGLAQRLPWLLAGSIGWFALSQMVMFDMLLTVSTLCGLLGVWRAAHSDRIANWGLVALAIGAGLLIKGPVIFVHVLAPAVLVPVWNQRARERPARWVGTCVLAALAGTGLAAMWAIPAAIAGGADYAAAILWGQTAGRMANSFAHARGAWFYVLMLPAMLLPWSLRLRAWRQLRASVMADSAGRFLISWLGSVFLTLTLISGKQLHYLLPLLPAAALLLARSPGIAADDRWLPLRALLTVVAVMTVATVYFSRQAPGLDLRQPAAALVALRQSGAEVATVAPYQGQLTFLGRDEQPLPDIPAVDIASWAATHSGAYLLTFADLPAADLPLRAVASYPYARRKTLTIWQVPVTPAAYPPATDDAPHD